MRHRRDCDALRARATTKRNIVFYYPDGMCSLWERTVHPDGQPTALFRNRARRQAAGVRPYGGFQHPGRPQHHRRLLTEIRLLLVRRTCQRIPPGTCRGARLLHDVGPKRLPDAQGAGSDFRFSKKGCLSWHWFVSASTFENAGVDTVGFEGRPIDLNAEARGLGKLDGGFAVPGGVGA